MTSINTNTLATIASNSLSRNERAMSNAMERLSTGIRINSAKDDAAGLAISSKMTSQIRGLNQAVRNANDAVSLIQTAEGALVEMSNMMQRMRELAVQSASDTNTSENREALDLEFQALKEEINRIGSNTQWNGNEILDSSFSSGSGTFVFQVGANADQTISLSIGDYRTQGSADGTVAVATGTGADSDDAQVSTITLGGTYAEGDVISLNYADVSFQYTITAADVAGANDAADQALIGASLLAEITGNDSYDATSVVATHAAGVITLTGQVDNEAFEVSAQAGGLLGNINDSEVDTQSAANAAITALDVAIQVLNNGRAEMGATINRLSYASDNLSNISSNALESRGRILDADYAAETTELARTQIIAQAGTAMLAQANQAKQSVLALLK